MMTYEGLMQLDGFKTTHFVTLDSIFGSDFMEYVGGIGEASLSAETMAKLDNPDDPLTKLFMKGNYEAKYVAGLLALDAPYINSSNFSEAIAKKYGTNNGEVVSQATWQAYWASMAKDWFSIFPSSPKGFVHSVEKWALFNLAGIVDKTTSVAFPALIKLATKLGIPGAAEAGDIINSIKDPEDITDDDKDLTSFTGWFDDGGSTYSYQIDELKGFYGSFYEDGYKMSPDAWESFDVEFDPSINIKEPKFLPDGSGGATLNPKYSP